MRLLRRGRADGQDEGRARLVAAARSGDAAALAALRADLDARAVARLAALLPPVPPEAAAVLRAARELGPGPAREQVVLVLLDGARRSPAVVAELLDAPLDAVLDARRAGLAGSAAAEEAPGCRGWLLVARADVVTGPEREAAEAHVAACRRCTAARAAALQAVRRGAVPGPRAAGG